MTGNKRLQDFTTFLSFKLGEYQGHGLMKNYPDGFNALIPQLAEELLSKADAATLKAVGEWLEGDCPTTLIVRPRKRRECMTCLEALKEGRMMGDSHNEQTGNG